MRVTKEDHLKIKRDMLFKKIMVFCLLITYGVNNTALQAQNLWQPWYIFPRAGAQHIALNGTWELSYMDAPVETLQQLSQRKDPFQTQIPNSVHWSLYKAGKLPHPYYNNNASLYKWTDEKVWYYVKTFELPATAKGNYAFLCFDGVDYFSRVWINDSLLGVHEGMFGGPNAEVSRLLKPGASNKIIVELRAGDWGNKAGDYEKLPTNRTGEIDYAARTGYNPRKSGRIMKPWVISGGSGGEAFFSLGMWQGARLEITPAIHLERPYLTTQKITDKNATLHLSVELFAGGHSFMQQLHPWNNAQIRHPDEKGEAFIPLDEKLTATVELYQGSQQKFSKEIPLHLYKGRNWLEKDLDIPHPDLWNPNGLGAPNLYTVKVAVKRNNTVIDQIAFPYGIRTIERVASAGPRTGDRFENWQFVINGKKIFVKGMNFTPQDILLETSAERYRWTLSAARNMGVQMIRIWGGGLLETNTLYEICNELGIMVWQDFPIGNMDTPEYPQDIWEAEVVQNICRLRNHPSLAIWCGGNEFNPYSFGNAASLGIIERNLHTFDNSRLFLRSTPDQGSIHAYPDMDPTWYNRSYGKEAWISETGMHSMPEANLFYEVVNKAEFKDLGKMWDKNFRKDHPELIHHFTEYGPGRVPRMLSRASHINDMSDPSIEAITEATQIGAGEFYQVLSEKVQGNYPVTTGLMPWVFKRHWPVVAIQMMDWFGQAGAPYYFLKRTYEPTHISVDLPRLLWSPGEKMNLDLKITNAAPVPGNTYTATVTVFEDDFKQVYKNNQQVNVAGGTTVTAAAAGSFTIPSSYKDRFIFILATLKDTKGKLVSSAYYYPRSLVKMEDSAFHQKYVSEPVPWIALDKGPWLQPTVAATSTSLSMKLKDTKNIGTDQCVLKFTVTNTGTIPAFMVKADITGVKRAFFASDNYLWLQPGETREIEMQVLWRDKKEGAVLESGAWNAKKVKINL